MAGLLMKKIKKRPRSRLKITDHVLDLFDAMEALEQQCTCGGDIYHRCDACEKHTEQHNLLHDELRLKPWQYPIENYEDTNKTGALEIYEMLKAASDARKQK